MNAVLIRTGVLITGANRGIGLELSRQLNQKGYFVFMGVRDVSKAREAIASLPSPGEAALLELDVNSAASIRKAVEQIRGTGIPLEILINNAGVMLDPDYAKDSTTDIEAGRLRETFDTNFFAVVELTNQVLPLLLDSPDPRILNISSNMGSMHLHARQEPLARTFAYNASKAALNMYTIHLANALRDKNVKVNSIHPGWVKTDMGTQYAPLEIPEAVEPIVEFLMNDMGTGRFVYRGEEVAW